jgi:outer membrane receptor protein involved in Fe transport
VGTTRRLCPFAAALALALAARAEEPPAPTEVDLFNLERALEVSVRSATLTEQPIEDTPAVVSVLTEDQIRVLGLRTLKDALRLMAGVTVLDTQLGVQSIGIRGVANAPNVLIALDGQRLNGFYDGTLPAQLQLHDLERIEVIRGPGSAIYGSDAFSGVVSLYTRRRDQAELELSGELLSGDRLGGGGAAQGKLSRTLGAWQLRASASFFDTTGPRILVERDTTMGAPYSQVPGDTRLPRRDLQIGASLERRGILADADSLELWTALITERRGPYFGLNRVFAPDDSLTRADFLSHLDYRIQLGSDVRVLLRGLFDRREASANVQDFPDGYTHDSNGNGQIDPGETFPEGKRRAYSYTSYRVGAQPSATATTPHGPFKGNRITLGAELEYEWLSQFDYGQNYRKGLYAGPHLDNYEDLPLTQRDKGRLLVARFIQDQLEISSALSLTLGLRDDQLSDAGSAWSPRAALVWRPLQRLAAKLLYGRAFRAPTLQELYDHTGTATTPLGNAVIGRADLKPETTNTLEAALEVTPAPLVNLRVNGFYIRTDGAIGPDAAFSFGGSPLLNYAGLRILGAETEAQLSFGEGGYLLVNGSWFTSSQLGGGLPGFEKDSTRRFLSTAMRDQPKVRANAALVLRPLSRLGLPGPLAQLRLGASYSFTGPSDNNQRTVDEALDQFHRPSFHELSLNALLPLTPSLELSARASGALQRTVPVALPSGWYELPDGPAASFFLSLRAHR